MTSLCYSGDPEGKYGGFDGSGVHLTADGVETLCGRRVIDAPVVPRVISPLSCSACYAQAHPKSPNRKDTMTTSPDLTQHDNPGVRWQAQMEEHLSVVRERIHVISRMTMLDGPEAIQAHATIASAAANAALALAIANTGSDLELGLSKLTDAVEDNDGGPTSGDDIIVIPREATARFMDAVAQLEETADELKKNQQPDDDVDAINEVASFASRVAGQVTT